MGLKLGTYEWIAKSECSTNSNGSSKEEQCRKTKRVTRIICKVKGIESEIRPTGKKI